jgi:hypothetical protein
VLSLERLRRFLETPEVEPLPVLTPTRPLGPAVSLNGVDLQWAADTQPFLQDVTLEANPRSLTVVIGKCSSHAFTVTEASDTAGPVDKYERRAFCSKARVCVRLLA